MEHNRRITDHYPDAELAESFMRCPRFDKHELTDEQIEEIAERAAQKAVKKAEDDFYKSVGKRAIGAVFYVVGIAAVGVTVLSIKMGWIKP